MQKSRWLQCQYSSYTPVILYLPFIKVSCSAKSAVYSRVLAARIRQTANVRFKLRISQDRKWADTENSLTLTVLMDKKLHEATNLCVEIMKSKRQLKGKLGPSYFKDLSSLSLNLFSTLQNELLKNSGIINWWSLTSYVSVLGAVSLKSR